VFPIKFSSASSDLQEIIPRELLFSEPLRCNPKISPDGTKLAYIASVNNIMNLWIKTIDKDDDRVITDFKKSSIFLYVWINNTYIIYLQDAEGTEEWLLYKLNIETGEVKILTPYKNIKVGFFSAHCEEFPHELIISMNKDNRSIQDLYHVDLNSDKITLIKKNPGNITDWFIDHNFKPGAIVVTNDDGTSDLMVKDHENNCWKKLITWHIEELPWCRPVGFSKDNKYIYVIDSGDYNTFCVVKIEIKTGKREIIAQKREYDIYTVNIHERKCDFGNHMIIFNHQTYDIQAVFCNKFRKEWIILDESIKEDFEAIKRLDPGDFSIIDRNNDDNLWLISFEHDTHPPSYYLFDRKSKKGTFLFHQGNLPGNYTPAHMEEVTFTSRDGLTLHGYITCPPGKIRTKLPLVLYVHSGPNYRDVWRYNPVVQWFASRGYVCLQINYRGSIGYGKAFLKAGNREWGGKMQDDLVDAVQWAVDNNIADPRKIAIYGTGYGGYTALAGATFTPDLFCCAVAIECPGNLVNFLKSIPLYMNFLRKRFLVTIGDPDREKDMLVNRSPFYKLDNIKIPLLIAYGLKSSRVKSSEPYKIVSTIKSKGIEVEHIVFPDEGHFVIRPENRHKFYTVAEKFLSKHMGGRYEPRKIYFKDIYISDGICNNNGDKILVDKILREGDTHAFEKLVHSYEKPLLKYLNKMTGDPKISNELLQETFCRVWLYLDSYLPHMSFFSWLFQIAANVVNKYRLKKSRFVNEISFDELNREPATEVWEENLRNKILVQSMLDSIREPYRTSLILRFMEDLDYKEIASVMNRNPNQIKNYLFRAKKSILKSWREDSV
jgi:RNA polymerase sigma factor (sigma-70 family)